MRRLLCVPIIHEEADLGSAGTALTRRSATLFGEQRWKVHQEVVGAFWEGVESYLHTFDPARLKLYQDGLAADGPLGRRIVEEAAARGSRNYRLIFELVRRGAEVRKTEDPLLLLRERESLLRLIQQREAQASPQEVEEKERLLGERDAFIAGTVGATLKEGEIGVLFIGAYHDVLSRLARDIAVEPVKDPKTVQAYFRELVSGREEDRLWELGRELAEPVARSPGPQFAAS